MKKRLFLFIAVLVSLFVFTTCNEPPLSWYSPRTTENHLTSTKTWERIGGGNKTYVWFSDGKVHIYQKGSSSQATFTAKMEYDVLGNGKEGYLDLSVKYFIEATLVLRCWITTNGVDEKLNLNFRNLEYDFLNGDYVKSKWKRPE